MYSNIPVFKYTVSASMQRQGFIFQNGFLGGVQFKKSLKKWTFKQKSGGFIQEKTPKHDFSHYMGQYSRVGMHSRGYGILFISEHLKKIHHQNRLSYKQ